MCLTGNRDMTPSSLVVWLWLLWLCAEIEVVHKDVGSEGHQSHPKPGEQVAEHCAPGEDGVFPPSLALGPRIPINRWRWRKVGHLFREVVFQNTRGRRRNALAYLDSQVVWIWDTADGELRPPGRPSLGQAICHFNFGALIRDLFKRRGQFSAHHLSLLPLASHPLLPIGPHNPSHVWRRRNVFRR